MKVHWKSSLYNTAPWYIGAVLTIFIYRATLKIPSSINNIAVEHADILNVRLGRIFGVSLSGWPLSHFLLFAILGYLYPDSWIFMTIMGILWECIEHAINLIQPGRPEHRPSALTQTEDDETTEYTHWMAGRSQDILFNSAGLLVGIGAHKIMS